MDIGALRTLLDNDIGYGDITTELLAPRKVRARIRVKQDAYISGLCVACDLLATCNVRTQLCVSDGSFVNEGTTLCSLEGDIRDILTAERTVLNVLQHMSGITTATRTCVDLAGPRVKVAGTRKTLFPQLDKMAIIAGGGDPHRWRLDDMFLIKDNHIRIMGIAEAVRQAREFSFSKRIEVEAETLDQAREAALAGADIIMLDNMTPDEIRTVIATLKDEGHDKPLFEASGMITKDTIADYADTGVDIVSMGSLTHSVTAVDMSLEIDGD